MAQTLVRVLNIKNTGRQVVPIAVKPRTDSPITTVSGTVQLQRNAAFVAEDDRFDIAQIRSFADKGLIIYEATRQLVTITDTGSSGSGS